MSSIINKNMKTIKTLLEEINKLTESAPGPELTPQRPVTDADTFGFTPNEFPLFNYKVLGAVAPDTQQQQEYVPGGNGLSIHRDSYLYLQQLGNMYGVEVAPMPGTPEAQMLRQQFPQYKPKNLYVLNNIIRHRERTSEIYSRLQKLSMTPIGNDHIKDYTDPYNQNPVQTMEPNYDMSSSQQNVETQDYNDAADVSGIS